MKWTYLGKPVTPEDLEGFNSFVYLITNTATGRKYIGKKRLLFTSHKKQKNGRRKKVLKPSDWEIYYGSSKELHDDLDKYGKESFNREIIRLCKSLSESNYYELREQMINDVLLKPDEYYNAYIGTRVNRQQLRIK